MRWTAKQKRTWRWWFAWRPTEIEGQWIWLEWYKCEDHGLYWVAWLPDSPSPLPMEERE